MKQHKTTVALLLGYPPLCPAILYSRSITRPQMFCFLTCSEKEKHVLSFGPPNVRLGQVWACMCAAQVFFFSSALLRLLFFAGGA